MIGTMNIYALHNHKVKYMFPSNGTFSDQCNVLNMLKEGEIYTVSETKVDGWHTDVSFIEIPGKWFNSVMFSDIAEQTKEQDKLHKQYAYYNK